MRNGDCATCKLGSSSVLIQAAQSRPIKTEHADAPLWAIRCRSAEGRARTGPFARAVRILSEFREARVCLAGGGTLSAQSGVRVGQQDIVRNGTMALK